jgi:hypothetical protein
VSRHRLTDGLDWLALALFVTALVIFVTGGVSFRISGVRIGARSVDRALLAAVATIALRVALDRRTRPLATLPGVAQRVRAAVYDRGADIPAPRMESRRLLVPALGMCAFGAVLLFPQLRRMDSVPDLGDPLFSMWRIGWVYQQILGDPRPLFSANIFHPYPLTLTYSDSMLLPALTTVPLLALGVHPVLSYNIVLLLSFVASAFAMYLLVERLTGSVTSAFVAGLLFGFYPYRFEHYSHFELQMTYWMPLALLALHRFSETARVRYALAAALCTVGQLYSSMYYAVFFVMSMTVVFPLHCWLTGAPVRRLLGPAAIAGVLALLLAWPLARTYGAGHLGDRDVASVEHYSATVSDYLRAHPRSATWGERTLPGRRPERALFPGLVVLVLALVALWPPIGPVRLVYVAGLLIAFELSRGFNDPFYRVLFDWFSPLRGLRAPARASVLVGLNLAVLAGFGVRRLMSGRRWPAGAVLSILIVAIAIDLRPLLRLESVWREPPPIYSRLSRAPGVVLAEFPFGGEGSKYTPGVPYLYFSIWHGSQMVNGYSGHEPEDYRDFQKAVDVFPDPAALPLLRARGVTHVTVNCVFYRNACDQVLEAVDAMPSLRLVSSFKWLDRPVRLYELARE